MTSFSRYRLARTTWIAPVCVAPLAATADRLTRNAMRQHGWIVEADAIRPMPRPRHRVRAFVKHFRCSIRYRRRRAVVYTVCCRRVIHAIQQVHVPSSCIRCLKRWYARIDIDLMRDAGIVIVAASLRRGSCSVPTLGMPM